MTKPTQTVLMAAALALGLGVAGSGVASEDPLDDGAAAFAQKDYATAMKLWRPLAEHGDAKAQFNLGLLYDDGQGVAEDDKEAVKWYRLAAEQGDAKGQHNLALMYDEGTGVAVDDKEAVKWFRLAAAQGHAGSQTNLGVMYQNGEGVAQDLVRAHMWYSLAAAQGEKSLPKYRDAIAAKMTPVQIAKAQEMATKCKASNYKICD